MPPPIPSTAEIDIRPLAHTFAAAAAEGRVDRASLAALLGWARAAPLRDFTAVARRMAGAAMALRPRAAPGAGGNPRGPMAALIAAEPDLAWLLIHAPYGYHRDAALLGLPVPRSAFDLAALLMRLDDWVPEVRQLAETRLALHAARIPAEAVAAVALTRRHRLDTAWRITPAGHRHVQAMLARADVPEAVVRLVREGQGGGLRAAWLRLVESTAYDAALPMLAREAAHPSIRASALWWLMDGHVIYADWSHDRARGRRPGPRQGRRALSVTVEPGPLMADAAADRASQVRKVAAEMLALYARSNPEAAVALARRLAQDRHKGVRERAEWFLRPR